MTERKFELSGGIVVERLEHGGVSYDIFDVDQWPGSIDEGRELARFIVNSLNRHSNMLQATLELCANLELACERTGTDWIGSGVRNAIVNVRASLLEYGMSALPNAVKDPYDGNI